MDLLARYWQTVDTGDLQGFAGTFAPDGSLENYTGTVKGRATLAQWLKDYEPSRAGNRHYSVSPLITRIDDTTVSVWSYMVVLAVAKPRTKTPHVIAFGRFTDRVVKIEGRWQFAHRLMLDCAAR